jgi:hypothetical protein
MGTPWGGNMAGVIYVVPGAGGAGRALGQFMGPGGGRVGWAVAVYNWGKRGATLTADLFLRVRANFGDRGAIYGL